MNDNSNSSCMSDRDKGESQQSPRRGGTKDTARMDRIKAQAKKTTTKDLKVTADDFDPSVIVDMLGLPFLVFFDGDEQASGDQATGSSKP